LSANTAYACSFNATSRKLNRIKINDLLNNADESNELMISSSIPKFKTDLKAPDIRAMSENSENDDDDSIVMLKTKLEELVMEDSDIEEYYKGLQSRLNQKKIDEIYNIVRSDIPLTPFRKSSSNAETKAFTLKENRHLTHKSDFKISPRFIQETITDGEDEIPEEKNTSLEATNENNFDNLSERIMSGEIGIQTEDENSSQLTLDMVPDKEEKENEDDINLKIAFDMINNDELSEVSSDSDETDETIFSKLFKYRVFSDDDEIKEEIAKENEEYQGFEYESTADKAESEKLLKNSASLAFKKLICTLAIFALIFILKTTARLNDSFAELISYTKYGILYIFAELQLMFFAIALHKGTFLNGLKSFTTGKLSSESVFSATTLITTLHTICALFNQKNGIVIFTSIPALMALFISIATYLKCKKDLYCFSIISTDEEKYAAAELSANSKEASSFYTYLLEDSDVYTVSKSSFISSFFKRISEKPKSEDILIAIIPGLFFVSATIFAICFFHGNMNIYSSFTASTAFLCAAMPATSFFVITIPLIRANLICKNLDSAIIGERAAEEYANASVISFEDLEIFPSNRVKMTNMKAYHNMRIDQIIVELSKLFAHIGGPLKSLFSDAVDGVIEEHTVIKVIESEENGLIIAADGVDYYLGNGSFMKSRGLLFEEEDEDRIYEKNGGSVMFFGANSILAAKLYFKYTPQKGFKKLLSDMYKCGLCIGIKTLDPNINNTLLAFHADGLECPISILKSESPADVTEHFETIDSGIVSKHSMRSFLKTFMLCDKARHSIKSNGIIMLSGVILTSLLMVFLSITGGISDFSSEHAFIFQTLWSLVIFILSFLK